MTSNIQRIPLIDTIRGIALFGILVFNIQTYALFTFLTPEHVYMLQLDKPDSYAPLQFIFHTLVNGQFYTIYSFLFGLGFYMMKEKNDQLGLNSNKLFKHRLWILLIFGLIHGLIFWFGDILHKYAILGFTLLYFNKKSIKTLFKWIAGLMIFSVVLKITTTILMQDSNAPNPQEIDPIIKEVMNTWQHGSFMEVVSLQKLGVAMLWFISIINGLSAATSILIMFIVGLIAGKINFFNRIPELKGKLLKFLSIFLPISLLLKAFSALDIFNLQIFSNVPPIIRDLVFSVTNFISVPVLAVCYLIVLSLALHKNSSTFFKWIANAGKLGLTNYLMQTIICMFLFYGYGFGLSGKLTLFETFLCVIPIYIFQLIFSSIWIKYYKTGPVETLWRRLSGMSKESKKTKSI